MLARNFKAPPNRLGGIISIQRFSVIRSALDTLRAERLEQKMTLDVDKVEAILHKYWQIPSNLSRSEMRNHAFRITVLIAQKYSRDNLKYQLSLIQTKNLQQNFDELACDQIASDLLESAHP